MQKTTSRKVTRYGITYVEGCRSYGEYGDSWTNYAILPASVSDEQALEITGAQAYSEGPGRGFGRYPVVRRTGTRVLVTQMCGIDC